MRENISFEVNVVGLYMNQPDHGLALCVDEKSQIQNSIARGLNCL